MEKIGKNTKQNRVTTFIDKELLYSVYGLLTIGVMAVFSASEFRCVINELNLMHFLGLHIFWLVAGLIGMFCFAKLDYKKLHKYTFSFALIVLILLLLIKFTPIGLSVNGAKRWINLGVMSFQPSELAKISVIMLLASLFSLKTNEFKEKWLFYISPIFLMIGLIYKQPNLSMTIILLSLCLFMYIFSGKSLKWIALLCSIGIIFCVFELTGLTHIVFSHIEPYQFSRITNWRHPDADIQGEGYNVYQSLIAVSSGGMFGDGYGASKAKLGWLPEAHTDFIFSVISEEMGFVFSLLIIGLFLFILSRGFLIAYRKNDLYGKLLASGITSSICVQAFFNISVATAFLPATGITLPFISYGGSSLLVSLCMVGILLNISKRSLNIVR